MPPTHSFKHFPKKSNVYVFVKYVQFFHLAQLEKRQNTTISEKDRNERLTSTLLLLLVHTLLILTTKNRLSY